MSQPISVNDLPVEQRARFKELTRTPAIAWPTVTLWLLVTAAFIASDRAAIAGTLPLWAAALINAAVGYLAFSVGHDSIHRAISSNLRVNDWIGQLAVLLVAPYVNMRMFRWAHILHHRFASGPNDPDIVLHGPAWSLPLRWMVIDVLYFIHALRHGDKVSRPYLVKSLQCTAVCAVIAAVLVATGHGLEVLMLWFVPSRLIFITLGFTFFWLPHVPHDTTQAENFTRATTIREGHEWFMAPALQYQHVHLIHHLFPMTPFYNNDKVWKLVEPLLRQKELAIQHGFAIRPVIHKPDLSQA
ncbi:MAG: hypothetical protein NVS9B10_01560 [Nevskia sp.]